ncbi:EamA family transporter [Actinomadura bangladeshensis]|uniref:EamA family transporter n=1 Tax=Actinomadura bangladeshensis TaxID=453573 RepID=A0A6L9QQ69_9ACTN|nr:EamA family transporter [Actinomadura bangladeshensis]NEA27595.1 EamA family transporter [Actinomadura bangladeshensis]
MVTVLALSAALAYGVADFLGGTVTRRSTAIRALTWCVPIGLAVVLVSALLSGGSPSAGPMAWGFVAGISGGAGLITFYRALARGPMSVVAPVSALAAAVLPVGVGIAEGERLDASVLVGVLLCLVAIGLVSMEADDAARATAPRADGWRRLLDSGPFMAGVSGICFGVFFVLLKEAGDGSGLWPIVGARLGNLVIVIAALTFLAFRGGDKGPRVSGRTLIGLALLSGSLDAGANVLYFLAVHGGMLSLAAVLTSLYPAITVLLARVAYSERLRVVQRVGMAVAVAGVALVTVG